MINFAFWFNDMSKKKFTWSFVYILSHRVNIQLKLCNFWINSFINLLISARRRDFTPDLQTQWFEKSQECLWPLLSLPTAENAGEVFRECDFSAQIKKGWTLTELNSSALRCCSQGLPLKFKGPAGALLRRRASATASPYGALTHQHSSFPFHPLVLVKRIMTPPFKTPRQPFSRLS